MRENNKNGNLVKLIIIAADFILLNLILLAAAKWNPLMESWPFSRIRVFFIFANVGLVISQFYYSTIINYRKVNAADIVLLVRYLNDEELPSSCDISKADMNKNSRVNTTDLDLLVKAVMGEDVTE